MRRPRPALLFAIVAAACAHEEPGSERGRCAANRTCNGALICLSDLCVQPPADCPAVASHLVELNVEGKREELIAACNARNLDAAGRECLVRAPNPEEAARCPGAADAHADGFWTVPSCHDVAANMVKAMLAPGAPEAEAKKQTAELESQCKSQNVDPKTLRCLAHADGQEQISACMTAARAEAEDRNPSRRVAIDTKLGLPVCDDYVAAMRECMTKMPPQSAKGMNDELEKVLAVWQDAAATPDGRQALAGVCARAVEAARQAYMPIGCQFGLVRKPR